ncbi:MAG TPA: SCO family protein [Gemmataceae bacterium]|nr:SCO family protein [Gemmataceae bacterium]
MPHIPAGRAAVGLLAALLCLIGLSSCGPAPSNREGDGDDVALSLPDFTLTERSGRTVHLSDLTGKVWVASFIFTTCTGPCPAVTGTMAQLQSEFAKEPDFQLVTFTVDPKDDTPAVLTDYAKKYGAKPDRWLFLTGKEADVYKLLGDGFHVGAQKNTSADATPGTAVTHDTHLAVVDRRGRIRGYFSGKADPESENPDQDFEKEMDRLRRKVAALLREAP